MASDVNDIITIKQLLNNSIIDIHCDYIKQIISKNVEDCNLLYTQVCYLIKLFLLHDYETSNEKYNDYNFNEMFIRDCFRLIKTSNIELDNDNKFALINRLFKFYNDYNLNQNNSIKFTKPNDVASITHITDALSRDIQTNISNNIILNYDKYVREYIDINIKLEFDKTDTKQINQIFNDVINNTLYSNVIYHNWINKHKKLIVPNFQKHICIKNFEDGITNYYNIFVKFIEKYVKENQILLNLIFINNDDKNKITKILINKLKGIDNDEFLNYNNWINENKNLMVNEFNLSKKNDINKELEKNPYMFIPFMLYMNKNMELNKSTKSYQIIPLRTNLTPKFIPINIDSFVDILDSKYLLGKRKNDYHNDNKTGLILFETYFKFDSKYIKNTIKKGYVFSGLIHTNGYEINYIFNSKSHEANKNNFHSKGKETRKNIKENTKNLTNDEKKKYFEKLEIEKEQAKKEKRELNRNKNNILKQSKKENHNKIMKTLEVQLTELKNKYNKDMMEIEEEHYKNLKLELDKIDKTNKEMIENKMNELNNIFISNNVYLKYVYDKDYQTLKNDLNNTINVKYDEIKNKELKIDLNLSKLKTKMQILKNELRQIKNEIKYVKIDDEKINVEKEYKKKTKSINVSINNNKKNKKTLSVVIKKMKKKIELLNYETIHNKTLTFTHITSIINTISNLLIKIYKINVTKSFNKYVDELKNANIMRNINEHILSFKDEMKNINGINKVLINANNDIKKININDVVSEIKLLENSQSLNNFLDKLMKKNELDNINEYLLSNLDKIKAITDICFKYLSVDMSNNSNIIDIINLMNYRLEKMEKKENNKTNEWNSKYNNVIKKIEECSLNINKLMNDKRKVENEMI